MMVEPALISSSCVQDEQETGGLEMLQRCQQSDAATTAAQVVMLHHSWLHAVLLLNPLHPARLATHPDQKP
jgi:hypothetical protein